MTFPFPAFIPGQSMPAAFSFIDQNSIAINAVTVSNTITPVGYDMPAEVSVTNGAEYSVSGGAWTSLVGTISPGQTIQVRMAAASTWSTARSTVVTIGGRSTTWTLTTGAAQSGAWDTGWTTGSWTFTTPVFFNWLRVQLWGPGGGGGGGGGGHGTPYLANTSAASGGNGGSGGYAQFAGGPYVDGGGYGSGGGGGWYGNSELNLGPGGDGGTSYHGTGHGGDTNTYAGGAGGGAGGSGGSGGYGMNGGRGGDGGLGGYLLKTYTWGQIAPSTGFAVYVQAPGGAGSPGAPYGSGSDGNWGAGGSYGRAYIDWG